MTAAETYEGAACKLGHTERYVANRKCVACFRATLRRRAFARYGMSEEDYSALITAQGARCAICGSDDPGRGKDWCVDHDHRSERVRGLLCFRCNLALGLLDDDPTRLRSAATYLEHNQ